MGDANDGGGGQGSVGAPANERQFVAELMHGGPDVVEELNFDDWLEAARRPCRRRGRRCWLRPAAELKTRSQPNSHCRPAVSLKTPPLPLTSLCSRYSSRRAVGDVFAEDDDARVAAHFVVQAGVDEVGHGAVLARPAGGSGLRGRGGWDRSPRNTDGGGSRPSRWKAAAALKARSAAWRTSSSTCFSRRVDAPRRRGCLRGAGTSANWNGIAQRVGVALGLRTVEAVVVGERMRVGADDVAVDKAPGLCRCGSGRPRPQRRGRQAIGSVPSTSAKWKLGKSATS